MSFLLKKTAMPTAEQALPGRSTPIASGSLHAVSGHCYHPPFPEHLQQAVFGMGCFWGAERKFWQQAGVYATAVGYAGGYTPNPTYQEVCSGLTGHAEVVLVVFDPHTVSYPALLAVFWESHNPTQGMRQATTSAPSTVQPFTATANRNLPPPTPAWLHTRRHWPAPACRRSRPKSATRRRFTMPNWNTSNIWRKTRTVIAASADWGFVTRAE